MILVLWYLTEIQKIEESLKAVVSLLASSWELKMDGEFRTKAEEKAHLAKIVQEWNDSRLDMFALSMPDKVCMGVNACMDTWIIEWRNQM